MKKVAALCTLTVPLLFGSCQDSVDTAEDPPSPQTDRRQIVFVSNRDTEETVFQVFIMYADGTHVRRLTHDTNNYFFPRFSPDGTHILFYSQNGADDEIYLMDSDGENVVNLTRSPGNDRLPQYSPDGSKIVFVSDRDGNREIYLMNADGSHQERLTQNNVTDHSPQFSPDGRTVVFYSTSYDPSNFENPESYDLYTIELEGKSLTRLTPDGAYFHFTAGDCSPSVLDATPRFSPDGSKIVFQNKLAISMMSADGGNRVNLVYYDFAPFFYPDGQQILFRSHRGADFDLYRMRIYAGTPIRVTNDNGHTYFGDFSDDGARILYFSNIDEERAEYCHIYSADADGRNRVKLTSGAFADYFPDFQPGKQM